MNSGARQESSIGDKKYNHRKQVDITAVELTENEATNGTVRK